MKEGWSFCIVTAPGNEKILSQCVKKIQQVFSEVENYEIIIVGNPTLRKGLKNNNVKLLPFNEYIFCPNLAMQSLKNCVKTISLSPLLYRTGAISHKKNLAAKNAIYSNLCILHDYVGLEDGWLSGFERFGNDWDVCMNVVLNNDNRRNRDWMAWDHPEVTNNSNGDGACLIPYDKYTKYMYISGTYFCVKNEFYRTNPLNEKLYWGEAEDVEWSLRVRDRTTFKMNENSIVKFLKLKDVNGAPNIDNWKRNGRRMKEVFEAE